MKHQKEASTSYVKSLTLGALVSAAVVALLVGTKSSEEVHVGDLQNNGFISMNECAWVTYED